MLEIGTILSEYESSAVENRIVSEIIIKNSSGRRAGEGRGGGGAWCWCGGGGGGADMMFKSVSVHAHARVQLIKMGQCQCTDPFGWTDQPEPPTPVASECRFQASPSAKSPNPKARKKIARHAHLSPLSSRRKGGAIFSISSALSAQELGPE